MVDKQTDTFVYMGIQDGKAVYSWVCDSGSETQPWMTMRVCRDFSEAANKKPVFVNMRKP